jgi:hypothetical protein
MRIIIVHASQAKSQSVSEATRRTDVSANTTHSAASLGYWQLLCLVCASAAVRCEQVAGNGYKERHKERRTSWGKTRGIGVSYRCQGGVFCASLT